MKQRGKQSVCVFLAAVIQISQNSDPNFEDLLALDIFLPVRVRERTETAHNGNVIKRQLVAVLMSL